VRFCCEKLGATALEASENFRSLDYRRDLGLEFDLIWSGSLLTHLDQQRFRDALDFFARSLAADGIAILTLHGRYSPYLQRHHWKYCPDERFEIAEKGFEASGFGYVDYEGADRYGVSLSRPSFTAATVEGIPGVRIVGYHERRWDGHQDVLVLRKTDIHD